MARRKNSKRNEIITQAGKLLHEKGYSGCNMRDISDACAISREALYKHFNNKEDLASLFFTRFQKSLLYVTESANKNSSASETLCYFWLQLYTWIEQDKKFGRFSYELAVTSENITKNSYLVFSNNTYLESMFAYDLKGDELYLALEQITAVGAIMISYIINGKLTAEDAACRTVDFCVFLMRAPEKRAHCDMQEYIEKHGNSILRHTDLLNDVFLSFFGQPYDD